MRQAFIDSLVKIARRDRSVWLLTGDLGFTVLEPFRDEFPDRFLNMGAAEENMVGVAAGLASTGKKVVCYTIAPFITYRPYEMVRIDVASHRLPVLLVGVGAGVAYSEAGLTHHAVSDMALMRTIPGMSVYSPSDPAEVSWATETALASSGPAYLRLGKSGEPLLTGAKARISGKIHELRAGKEIAILATGAILGECLAAAKILETHGVAVSVSCVHQLKPLDVRGVMKTVKGKNLCVTVEEHGIVGGLASAIAETMMASQDVPPLLPVAIPDEFVRIGGSHGYMKKHLGLDAESIARKIAKRYETIAHA